MTTFTNLGIPYIDHMLSDPAIPENTTKDIIDKLLSGYLVYDCVAADNTGGQHVFNMEDSAFTSSDWHNSTIEITDTGGVLTGQINIILPPRYRQYIVINSTGQTLAFKTTIGTSADIIAGKSAHIHCYNGEDVIQISLVADNAGSYFNTLTDVPDYVGHGGEFVRVAVAENGVEYTDDILVLSEDSTVSGNLTLSGDNVYGGDNTFVEYINITQPGVDSGAGIYLKNAAGTTDIGYIGIYPNTANPNAMELVNFKSSYDGLVRLSVLTGAATVSYIEWDGTNLYASGAPTAYFITDTGPTTIDHISIDGIISGDWTVKGDPVIDGTATDAGADLIIQDTNLNNCTFVQHGEISEAMAAVAFDLSGASVFTKTLTATTFTFTVSNAPTNTSFTFLMTNGGLATSITWPSGTEWAAGIEPDWTVSGDDLIIFTKIGSRYIGGAQLDVG